MPIPFLEALRGRLAPVFNGTVPLEREKESITNGAWQACQGPDGTAGTDTRARHKYLHLHNQNAARGLESGGGHFEHMFTTFNVLWEDQEGETEG